jgi:fatty acid CoA ligase FadD9
MKDIEMIDPSNTYDYVITKPDKCLTIFYTSGSLGVPKGAMISENTFRSTFERWCPSSSPDYIYFSYRPLAWAADRSAIIATFLCGGRTAFFTGDISRLMEELVLVRPSDFAASPSIWNKIYTEFKTALALVTAHQPPETVPAEEQRLLQQFSKLIPNRCKILTVGGAMVSPVILNFMKRCFSQCSIEESYGITECGAVAYNNTAESTLQYRLESAPDIGYTLDDKPFPRGELLAKTPQMFSGYINNPEETRAALTEDGFFRTGDIVELRHNPSGSANIHVVDRKKNFFKLSQGQFVSPEFLQGIYIQSVFIDQIYIHGDLLADSVTAVIVPTRDFAEVFAREHNLTHFDIHNPDPLFCDAVLQDICSIAEKESLRKHEIPSRIIIDFEPFTPENGLLTSSMKPCRHKLAAHYADRLKPPNTIEQRLKSIIETVTGQSMSSGKEENFFLNVGGDSLAAVRLSRMIENDLGIPLPLNILFHPKMTLTQLTTLIQDPSQISSFSRSIVPQLLSDAELDLNITVGECKTTATSPSMIFVTGTTGFVGAFLLAELLTVYASHCKFVCLVRCELSVNPLDRLRQNMLFYQIWKDDYQERIIALRGDLAQSCFGLDSETYASFAHQIDLIFHCGATVNFILPYSRLYAPNVCGTREIIRLATHTTSTCIPVHYISTISVLPPGVDKEIAINEMSPDRLIGGYAQSKWVAEKLIAKASHCGLPVVIYRLGLICADARTGACNPNDLYTLLFAAMMKMSCYPESAIHARLTGLPVDFTAKSIVYLSGVKPDVYGKIYHVINPNGEVLFEEVRSGIRKCGVELESVSNDEWRMKVKANADQNSRFESVGEFFFDGAFKERCTVLAEQFSSAVCSLEFPSLDNDYVFKWLSFILHNIIRT